MNYQELIDVGLYTHKDVLNVIREKLESSYANEFKNADEETQEEIRTAIETYLTRTPLTEHKVSSKLLAEHTTESPLSIEKLNDITIARFEPLNREYQKSLESKNVPTSTTALVLATDILPGLVGGKTEGLDLLTKSIEENTPVYVAIKTIDANNEEAVNYFRLEDWNNRRKDVFMHYIGDKNGVVSGRTQIAPFLPTYKELTYQLEEASGIEFLSKEVVEGRTKELPIIDDEPTKLAAEPEEGISPALDEENPETTEKIREPIDLRTTFAPLKTKTVAPAEAPTLTVPAEVPPLEKSDLTEDPELRELSAEEVPPAATEETLAPITAESGGGAGGKLPPTDNASTQTPDEDPDKNTSDAPNNNPEVAQEISPLEFESYKYGSDEERQAAIDALTARNVRIPENATDGEILRL